MKRYLILRNALGWRPTNAMGWTSVLTVSKTRILHTILRFGVFAIGVSAVLLAASPARAFLFGAYQFREVSNTLSQFSSFGFPAINDRGTIAAVFNLDTGGQQVL